MRTVRIGGRADCSSEAPTLQRQPQRGNDFRREPFRRSVPRKATRRLRRAGEKLDPGNLIQKRFREPAARTNFAGFVRRRISDPPRSASPDRAVEEERTPQSEIYLEK